MTYKAKLWGATKCLVERGTTEVHEIQVVPGGYCSVHWHEHKTNMFYVISGVLEIYTFIGEEKSLTVVSAGQHISVPSKMPHMFKALTAVHALEVYYPDVSCVCLTSDIVRLSEGGVA